MNLKRFDGKVALQQRVFPAYRLAFFQRLSQACEGFSLFAGPPRSDEAILQAEETSGVGFTGARNVHLSRGRAYICLQSNLLDWLGAYDPEVLILEANPRYLSNRRAMGWMQARSRPVIGWGLGAPSASGGLSKIFRNPYLRRFDAMIAYSSLGARQYVQAGLPEERVFVAKNAAAAVPASAPAREVRSGLMKVLYVGRLQERKRLDLLLQGCARLDPSPELTIVGDGPARDRLAALAQRILPAAQFAGALQGQPLMQYFEQSELFVLPGTGGLAAQEAMAHGLPIIIAEGDGTQQDLVTSKNGWLVEPGNLEALTRALAEAMSRRADLPKMGIESYRMVKEHINIDAMAATFVEVLRTVTGG